MEHYQLKLFGSQLGKPGHGNPTGGFDFEADNNLAAVEHAKLASLAAHSAYAVLRQRDVGVIWEDYALYGKP
jgi:hypothetical protein